MSSFFQLVVNLLKLQRGAQADSETTSGPPKTHGTLSNIELQILGRVQRADRYVCSNAVDSVKLLRLTRKELVKSAQKHGGNALVNEQWTCTIYKRGDEYRVIVVYSADAASAPKAKDVGCPVALDQTKRVGELMTVVSRETLETPGANE